MSPSNNGSKIYSLALRGAALAMGVAAVVLGILQAAPVETTVVLLGIGLSTLALDALAPRAMSIGGVPMRSIRERGLDQGKES
jgi:hypothetical protein